MPLMGTGCTHRLSVLLAVVIVGAVVALYCKLLQLASF